MSDFINKSKDCAVRILLIVVLAAACHLSCFSEKSDKQNYRDAEYVNLDVLQMDFQELEDFVGDFVIPILKSIDYDFPTDALTFKFLSHDNVDYLFITIIRGDIPWIEDKHNTFLTEVGGYYAYVSTTSPTQYFRFTGKKKKILSQFNLIINDDEIAWIFKIKGHHLEYKAFDHFNNKWIAGLARRRLVPSSGCLKEIDSTFFDNPKFWFRRLQPPETINPYSFPSLY